MIPCQIDLFDVPVLQRVQRNLSGAECGHRSEREERRCTLLAPPVFNRLGSPMLTELVEQVDGLEAEAE